MSSLLGDRYQFIKALRSDPLEPVYLVGDTKHPSRLECVVRHWEIPERNPRTLKFILTLLRKKAESFQKLSQHDRLPAILDFFEEGNNFYLVEEYVPGHTLDQELIPGLPLTDGQVVQLLQDMLEVLAIVHSWGMMHRRPTPSHWIRRQFDGALILTGFGIFQEIGTQNGRWSDLSALNDQGSGPSSASIYFPPDVATNRIQFDVDLYPLGVMGIQALTGLSEVNLQAVLPVHSGQAGTWHDQVTAHPALVATLDRLVHPLSQQRYQRTSDVLNDLRQVPLGNGTSNTAASPVPAVSPAASPVRPAIAMPRLNKRAIALLVATFSVAALFASRLPQSLVAKHLLRQGALHQQGNAPQRAITSYTQAIQLQPSAQAHLNRAMTLVQQGDRSAALEDLNRALDLDPNLAQAYHQRANLWFELGNNSRALADYTEVLRLEPDSVNAYVNRGTVRAALGDERGAIQDYTQALQYDPRLMAAYLNRCLSRSNLEDHQGAITDCTQAINLQPNSVAAYQNRGLARRRLGDKTGAIEDLNLAIRLAPQDADPYYNRGLVRQDLGDRNGAIVDFTTAIRHNPHHPFAYYDRALVLAELGDRQGAIADLEKSASLCLDSGRRDCYDDAQFELQKLTGRSPEVDSPDSTR